jgi:putative membrane protein
MFWVNSPAWEAPMRTQLSQYPIVLLSGYLLLAGAACERKDGADVTTGEVRPPADTQTTAEPAPLTDANSVALLDEANAADSAAGALAAQKATNRDVRNYAKLMMSEHHALRVQGQQLAKKLGVSPKAPPFDLVKDLAGREMAALQSAAKGRDFDRTYIDQEVLIHQEVIRLAEQAHASTQQEDLKALIAEAKPTLQKHLERAEEIQQKLGKPAGAGT